MLMRNAGIGCSRCCVALGISSTANYCSPYPIWRLSHRTMSIARDIISAFQFVLPVRSTCRTHPVHLHLCNSASPVGRVRRLELAMLRHSCRRLRQTSVPNEFNQPSFTEQHKTFTRICRILAWNLGFHSIISWPACFNFCVVSFKALVTGGVGKQIPSFHNTAILSFGLGSTCRQGIGSIFGSTSHGCASTIAFEYNTISSSVFPIGPLTL